MTDTLAGVLKTRDRSRQRCRRRRRRRSASCCAAASSATRRTACTTSPTRASCSTRRSPAAADERGAAVPRWCARPAAGAVGVDRRSSPRAARARAWLWARSSPARRRAGARDALPAGAAGGWKSGRRRHAAARHLAGRPAARVAAVDEDGRTRCSLGELGASTGAAAGHRAGAGRRSSRRTASGSATSATAS